MCGRYALSATPEELAALLSLLSIEDFPPRYNIAPTQPVLMVLGGPQREGTNAPDRRALLVRWGLIPGWAKNPADMPLLINARAETAAEKAAFRAAMRHRRALVPASGFYEWKCEGGARRPYWVRPRHGGAIAFAGLVETWSEPGGSEMDTGAILTSAASDDLSHIHHRMPAVVTPENFSRWLDCLANEPRDVADILQPPEPGFFEAVPVSDRVNKLANTGPDIQEPVEPDGDDENPSAPAGRQFRLL